MAEILSKLKKIKFEHIVVIILAIAVGAVAIMTFGSGGEKEESYIGETEKYVSSLEKKLSETLSKINGADKVSVVITVNSGISSDIAKDEKTVSNGEKTTTTSVPVLVGGKPIVIREVYPEITGVVIVAKGADNINVKMALLDAATTALGISCDRIKILSQ